MSLLNNSESLFRHNRVGSDIIGKDRGSPAVRGNYPGEHPGHGGFSCTVLTKEAKYLSLMNIKIPLAIIPENIFFRNR